MVETKTITGSSSTTRCGEDLRDVIVSEAYPVEPPFEMNEPNEFTLIARFGKLFPDSNS